MGILVLAATVVLFSLLASSASQETNTTFPLTYRARSAEGGEEVCSPDELRQRLQAITRNDVSNLLKNSLPALLPCSDTNLGQLEHCPAVSCRDIVRLGQVLHPSDYYWIRSSNGSTVRVYCDIDDAMCNLGRGTTQNNPADSCSGVIYTCPSGFYWVRSSNGTAVQVYCAPPTTAPPTTAPPTTAPTQCGGGQWRRVVSLNMTNTSHVCPSGFRLTSYSRKTCGRANSSSYSCSSTTFSVGGSQYSRVCGRALAYRWGYNYAFYGYHARRQSIDGQYVDGLSLTHGAPHSRQHIWTFASGLFTGDHSSSHPRFRCPCDNGNTTYRSPPFVGNDYFCESTRTASTWSGRFRFYPNATLWDGQVCEGGGTCCRFNNPPWFTKNLTSPTTDQMELRLCLTDPSSVSDVALELLELYVQ